MANPTDQDAVGDPARPSGGTDQRRRILFVAEAATLAHVARPAVLAASLDRHRYEPYLAVDPRYDHLLQLDCPRRPIRSIPSAQFLEALAKGSPLYDSATLRRYVEEDLAVFDEIQPSVVVGDFRLSLSISARLRGIPYLALSNAYWSPYSRSDYPLPDVDFVRWLGVTLGNWVFQTVRPVAFAYHTLPLNRLRRQYGLPSLGMDLRRIYTDADVVMYADLPELMPLQAAPANHQFLGPMVWSPRVELPPWWHEIPADRPLIYVTLGSSGQASRLVPVLQALGVLKVRVMAATAGRVQIDTVPDNVYLADYLPGEAASARAHLVICNGGSPTTQQALVHGKPVLGIPTNLDQYLNMHALCRAGIGHLVRSGQANTLTIRRAIETMLTDTSYAEKAHELGQIARSYDAATRFGNCLEQVIQSA